jgi:hypothetical protein
MKWVRARATDLTGGQTIKVSTFGQMAPTAAQLPLAATITQDFRAPIVQSIEKGRDPSNVFQSRRFSGLASSQSTSVTLPANGTFLGTTWMSTLGFVGLGVLIKSDANSEIDGLKILFSADNGVNTHLIGGPVTYDAAPEGRIYKFGIAAPNTTFKISLTAGNSDMTNLTLRTYLLAEDTEDVSIQMGDTPNSNSIADLTIAQITAMRDGGGFYNIGATNSGNLKIAISEHTSDTPIKELVGGGSILTKIIDSEAVIQVDDPPLPGRKTISIYVDEDNVDDVYYGYSDNVTISSGFKLVPGASKEWEIGDNIHLYFTSPTDGQKIYVDQIA